ncbi:MAG: hypothetical protein HQM06_06435 [Magnetococcales bacterium]|nr:hypothetical protein [Magnetococcales bacterium]
MNLSRFRFKSRLFFYVNPPQRLGLIPFLKRQLLGLASLIAGIILAFPGVPGPGFVFIALAFLLLDFPGKASLLASLRHRRWFRIARVIIHRQLNILLILPK